MGVARKILEGGAEGGKNSIYVWEGGIKLRAFGACGKFSIYFLLFEIFAFQALVTIVLVGY